MTTSFLSRLAAIADARADVVAIACAGEPALTYRQLWDRASGIAGALLAAGAKPGEVVALHLHKSPEWVAGVVACWLARCAFVPIDPDLPELRRGAIVAETGARFAIGRSLAGCHVIEPGPGRVAVDASPDDRAYIIYTSGSTGEPKGVVVAHRGIVDLLDAQIAAFDLRAGDRCLWVLSPSFDASISDVGTALLAGATLHIEHPDRLRSPAGIGELLHARAITHVDLPPSLLPLLPEPPASLRTIIIGGEVCAPTAVRRWASRVRLVNVYGPTEATVCSTLCACSPTWDRPLLGQPLPNVMVHVELPERRHNNCYEGDVITNVLTALQGLSTVAASTIADRRAGTAEGELWISGPAVADGYLDRPELTAARFVERDGVRWFRTGDRVRRHPDGELEFLGRIDRQLKVSGVLVAPEEIETRLREHPAVADAAVVLERRGARELLVGYCVRRKSGQESAQLCSVASGQGAASDPEAGEGTLRRSVRAHLAAVLDRRLIPRRLFVVDAIPRGPTGKIELAKIELAKVGANIAAARNAPSGAVGPTHGRADSQAARPADSHDPRSVRLVDVIARVLELDAHEILPDDDFFELGGDSFAVLELVALAEPAGIPLAVEDVHRARTVRKLLQLDAARATSKSCAELAADVDPELTGLREGSRSCAELAADVDPALARFRARARSSGVARASVHSGPTVLLTGATGLLGTHVLEQLIARTEGRLICLTRAGNDRAAAARVASHGSSRIIGIAADLRSPRFGLDDATWAALADEVDTVVHCAADLSLGASYDELRATNVGGIANVLVFAAAGRPKTIHYASTLSVFVGSDRASAAGSRSPLDALAESDALETAGRLHGGYAQSKWAAEYLLREVAREHRLDAFVYRFGLLVGGPQRERDWLTAFVRGLAALGRYPEDAGDWRIDITPVAFASRVMLESIAGGTDRVLHVANRAPASLADLVRAIERAGTPMTQVSTADWRMLLEDAAPVVALATCRVGDAYDRARACDLFQATGVVFSMAATEQLAAARDIALPRPAAQLLAELVPEMLR